MSSPPIEARVDDLKIFSAGGLSMPVLAVAQGAGGGLGPRSGGETAISLFILMIAITLAINWCCPKDEVRE
jgi:hypothetical protein